MMRPTPFVWLFVLAVSSLSASDIDEFKVKREAVFEFAQKPQVARQGDRVTITFETKGFCDVTVAIEDPSTGAGPARIVRHLASGVLGSNAPEPFQRNSKEQAIVWDGKDDQGRYIEGRGSLTVRVSLGLKPRFERTLFWSPMKRSSPDALVACAPEGVYVYDGFGVDHLRLFDHNGTYVKTLYPFAAERLAEVQGLRWVDFPQGSRLPFKFSMYHQTLLNSGTNALERDKSVMGGRAATALAARTADPGGVILANLFLNRVAADGGSGGVPLQGAASSATVTIKGKQQRIGPRAAACSPDGRWVYLTAWHWYRELDWRYERWLPGVLKVPSTGDGRPSIFCGSLDEKDDGGAGDRLRVPLDVDCDAQGRVYVADYGNHRIQVFSPEGRVLKSIPVRYPAQVSVNRRTGEIFVGSWLVIHKFLSNAEVYERKVPPTLLRLGGFDDPAVKDRWDLPLGRGPGVVPLATFAVFQYRVEVDSWAERPTIWLLPGASNSSHTGNGIFLENMKDTGLKVLTLQDGTWRVKRDFAAEAARGVGRLKPAANLRQRLYVNPRTHKLYVGEDMGSGVTKSFWRLLEIDPVTGKTTELVLPFDCEDLCFDHQGLAYLRTDRLVARYDPATWREVPWDYGEERQKVTFSGFSTGRSADIVSGLVIPGHRPVCFHEGGMSVSIKGHLVVQCTNPASAEMAYLDQYGWRHRGKRVVDERKEYRPRSFPGRARWGEIHVWDRRGRLLYEDAIPGLTETFGVAMDKSDALYMLASPARVLDGKRYVNDLSTTLIKIRPKKGKVLSASGVCPVPLPTAERPKRPPEIVGAHLGRAWVDGAEWFYGGVGLGGFNPSYAGGGCSCWNCRFALDYFARSFAPELDLCSVAVLDTNGNLILRVGRYGNVDDGVPLILEGGPPTPGSLGGDETALFYPLFVATDTDRRLFIADIGNARIVSVRLDYYATERIALKDVPEKAPSQ